MTMTLQTCIQSKVFRRIVVGVGIFLIALVSFASGVSVGLHKARFSYAWGENYERHFLGGGPRGPMPGSMMGVPDGGGFRNPHGTSGVVVSMAENMLVVKDRDNQESNVRLSDQTRIMKQRTQISANDMQKDDMVMVIGKPSEDGVVSADFIRVFDHDGDDDARSPLDFDRER